MSAGYFSLPRRLESLTFFFKCNSVRNALSATLTKPSVDPVNLIPWHPLRKYNELKQSTARTHYYFKPIYSTSERYVLDGL